MIARVLFAAVALGVCSEAWAEPLRVQGSATFARALEAAAPAIKEELDIDLKINATSGSSAAIAAAGMGAVDLAIVTREVTGEDRSQFPSNRMSDVQIGMQVLVPIVSRETWDAGVKSISRSDFVLIYEREIRNWSKLGAQDLEVKFFNPERERGVWELFATWLYEDIRKAPPGKKWEVVLTDRDARNAVEFATGAISLAASQWADGKKIMALPVRDGDSPLVEATEENFFNGKWPMARPLILVTGDKPTGRVRKVMEFMCGPKGKAALEGAEFLQLPDAEKRVKEMLNR